jgi:plasmid stability protein
MADILLRNLSPELRDALKERARKRGHSLSDEIKAILARALGAEAAGAERIGSRMVALFQAAGTVELEIDRSEPAREPPDLS